MKRIIRAAAALCLAWIFAGALPVCAAEDAAVCAAFDVKYAAEAAGGSGEIYAAPPYGTKAVISPKLAFARQVSETAAFWQETAEALAPFTYGHNVKVENYSDPDEMGLIYESDGSGVIMAMDENFVYIATAAHCLKRANTVVTFADGISYRATVAYRNSAKDVGFIFVECAALKPGTMEAISPATGADAASLGKAGGDMLFAVSSVDGPNSSVYAGLLDQYSVVYPNNPQQNVMQFFSDVSHGSSGGAVYTAEGVWVGSVSGGDTYGICWAVPYSDILSEFNAWLTLLAMQQVAAVSAA